MFVVMVALGAFFLVNLALAVLALQFSKDREEEEGKAPQSPSDPALSAWAKQPGLTCVLCPVPCVSKYCMWLI